MTNKRKIEILKGVKSMFRSSRGDFGFCGAVYRLLTTAEEKKYDTYKSIRFLGIKKPKDIDEDEYYRNGYWYPLNKKGFAKRRKLIDEALKKLEA